MIQENVEIYALHGFLGNKTDWHSVFTFLKKEKPGWQLKAINLFEDPIPHLKKDLSLVSMQDWAKAFNAWVLDHERRASNERTPSTPKRILVGYSMGGRLALHALEQNISQWAGVVFLSTNPGLMTTAEKSSRLKADQVWADRFINESFHQVLSDWNAQPVFVGAPTPARAIENHDVQHLAHALTAWSLGVQDNFRDRIESWPIRQIWAAGERDKKFVELLATLPAHQGIQKWVIEEVGHRLLFECPQEVAHFIARAGSPIFA